MNDMLRDQVLRLRVELKQHEDYEDLIIKFFRIYDMPESFGVRILDKMAQESSGSDEFVQRLRECQMLEEK